MIKLISTKEGAMAVLKTDSHVSRWIEEHNSIRTDGLLNCVLPMIKPGMTVLDLGANVGDWTVPLAEAVGQDGLVLAFEPMPPTFACLMLNTRDYPQVTALPYVMANAAGVVTLNYDHQNVGASHVSVQGDGEYQAVATTLDTFYNFRRPIHFMKIDVEGSELSLLKGAKMILRDFRPKIICELNRGALARFNTTPEDVIGYMLSMGYGLEFVDKTHSLATHPQTDVFFLPV